ncbi:MAG: transposase [Saprospiraceae bacterium]
MSVPAWVLKHKEPKTEIKFINDSYYKYQVSYKYNKDKKRTDKITGQLLGKLDEDLGFIKSDKNTIREQAMAVALPKVDIKNYGICLLFYSLLKDELELFRKHFKVNIADTIFIFAMMRWAFQSPIKRAPSYFVHDYCSELYGKNTFSDKDFSNALKFVGENREALTQWMKDLLNIEENHNNKFVLMDSTHVTSVSEHLGINALGYNPAHSYDKQVRLMYLFSAQLKKPVYYRLINGNITDLKSMKLCIEEMKVKDVIYIADKGFYSKENITMLDKEGLQYLIPLHRNNNLINFEPIKAGKIKIENKTYFIYQERAIWYYTYENEGIKLITFLDDKLRTTEENDYLLRIQTKPEEYTETKYFEKLHVFGTLTLVYKTTDLSDPKELYIGYKKRNEVEVMFDSYKNFLKADLMYMQDRHVTEGWLAANFIAMIAYHKLFTRIQDAKLTTHVSPKDVIEICKSIYKIKMNGKWQISEITKKTAQLLNKLKIDYLND